MTTRSTPSSGTSSPKWIHRPRIAAAGAAHVDSAEGASHDHGERDRADEVCQHQQEADHWSGLCRLLTIRCCDPFACTPCETCQSKPLLVVGAVIFKSFSVATYELIGIESALDLENT